MVRRLVMNLRWQYFILRGMDIDKTAKVSPYARLDHTYPKGIHIGKYSFITGGCLILSHDLPVVFTPTHGLEIIVLSVWMRLYCLAYTSLTIA